MKRFEYSRKFVEIEVTVEVGGETVAEIMTTEFTRRSKELVDKTPTGKKPKGFTAVAWGLEMGVDDTLLNRLMNGEKTTTGMANVGRIGLYFRKRYGEDRQKEVLRAFGAWLEE